MKEFLSFLHSFIPLANFHSNDFLTDDIWNFCFPSDVQDQLNLITNPKSILLKFIEYKAVLSDYEDVATAEMSSMNWSAFVGPDDIFARKSQVMWNHVQNDVEQFIKLCAFYSKFSTFAQTRNCQMQGLFTNHCMNMKKSYEVQQMSLLCYEICQQYNIETVVDIGSGKGYLGTYLSLFKGINVIELDSKKSNSSGSKIRRNNVKCYVTHKCKKNDKQNLTASELSEGKCVNIVRQIASDDSLSVILREEAELMNNNPLLLTGLHCCGGLSATVLRNFLSSQQQFKALCLVGCCYHLLREKSVKNFPHETETIDSNVEFPMSSVLQCSGVILGRNARTIASQSVERLSVQNYSLDKSMFMRIILQQILLDKLGYTSDSWIVGCLRKQMQNCDDFVEYVRLGLKKLDLVDLSESLSDEEIKSYEDRYPDLPHHFSCLFYLKCIMAPLIENIIIWDRLQFLKENGITKSQIFELFEESKSPRRYVIVSIK